MRKEKCKSDIVALPVAVFLLSFYNFPSLKLPLFYLNRNKYKVWKGACSLILFLWALKSSQTVSGAVAMVLSAVHWYQNYRLLRTLFVPRPLCLFSLRQKATS